MKIKKVIPRGGTQVGVNAKIIGLIRQSRLQFKTHLDIPCGDGTFINLLQEFFPGKSHTGIDIAKFKDHYHFNFTTMDASKDFNLGETFDLITSISGIMVIGNAEQFIQCCAGHLNTGGLLIITNDNTVSLRDRLSYLFFGYLRRFKFMPLDGNYNNVSHHVVLKPLLKEHFVVDIEYTSVYKEDYLFVPLALPFFLIQRIMHFFNYKNSKNLKEYLSWNVIKKIFSFKSFYARHYIVIARKK